LFCSICKLIFSANDLAFSFLNRGFVFRKISTSRLEEEWTTKESHNSIMFTLLDDQTKQFMNDMKQMPMAQQMFGGSNNATNWRKEYKLRQQEFDQHFSTIEEQQLTSQSIPNLCKYDDDGECKPMDIVTKIPEYFEDVKQLTSGNGQPKKKKTKIGMIPKNQISTRTLLQKTLARVKDEKVQQPEPMREIPHSKPKIAKSFAEKINLQIEQNKMPIPINQGNGGGGGGGGGLRISSREKLLKMMH